MAKKKEIKPKIRGTLAKDFQSNPTLHKKGVSFAIACEVLSKDLGRMIVTIPDHVSLFLDKAETLADSANQSKKNIVSKQKYKNSIMDYVNKYLQSAMGAYIFLVAALESFLNVMIPPDYIYEHEKKGHLDKTSIQRDLNLFNKIKIVGDVNKVNIKGNTPLWSSITDIIDTRNDIVHMKDLKAVEQGVIYAKIFDINFEKAIEDVRTFILIINPKYFD